MSEKPISNNRYCIGCVFFDMTPRDPGCMGSTWTGIYGDEEARGFCKKGLWNYDLGTSLDLDDFRRFMEKAADCSQYTERPAPGKEKP